MARGVIYQTGKHYRGTFHGFHIWHDSIFDYYVCQRDTGVGEIRAPEGRDAREFRTERDAIRAAKMESE